MFVLFLLVVCLVWVFGLVPCVLYRCLGCVVWGCGSLLFLCMCSGFEGVFVDADCLLICVVLFDLDLDVLFGGMRGANFFP